MCECKRAKDVIEAELEVIKKHLDNHKWYKHIVDENEAAMDFIWNYAWIMRESFCGKLCPDSGHCKAIRKFNTGFLRDISDGELNEYIKQCRKSQPLDLSKAQLWVIKNHISIHKWINRIDNYADAIKDFLDKFGWVVEEIYNESKKINKRSKRTKKSKKRKI